MATERAERQGLGRAFPDLPQSLSPPLAPPQRFWSYFLGLVRVLPGLLNVFALTAVVAMQDLFHFAASFSTVP